MNAQRIQNAIVLGWNFCAQLPISSIGNDLSLPGSRPDSSQVYPAIGATLTCENSYVAWWVYEYLHFFFFFGWTMSTFSFMH